MKTFVAYAVTIIASGFIGSIAAAIVGLLGLPLVHLSRLSPLSKKQALSLLQGIGSVAGMVICGWFCFRWIKGPVAYGLVPFLTSLIHVPRLLLKGKIELPNTENYRGNFEDISARITIRWFLRGMMVGVPLAIAWFFFNQSKQQWRIENATHWRNSSMASEAVSKVISSYDGIIHVPESEKENLKEKLRVAVAEGEKVESGYMKAMNEGLAERYQTGYIDALSGILEGLEKKDTLTLKSNVEKFNEFSDWWDKNKSGFDLP